jgi:ribosomal protein L6P/L9E
MISLESFNPVKLGDFCSKIIALKKPNVYKGKGIWFKDANPELKAIKKT